MRSVQSSMQLTGEGEHLSDEDHRHFLGDDEIGQDTGHNGGNPENQVRQHGKGSVLVIVNAIKT